jgi:hypothetical protein
MPATPLDPRTPAPAAARTPSADAATPGTATPGTATARATARPIVAAAVLDAAAVLWFAAAGRSSHAESGGVLGVLGTAWPFLAGAAVGWVAVRAWRAPLRAWPTGVAVWAAAWALGLALRGLSGDGLAAPFVAVSAVVLAVLLIGWRGVATAVSAAVRGRARRSS